MPHKGVAAFVLFGTTVSVYTVCQGLVVELGSRAKSEDESGHLDAVLQAELLFKSSSKCAWASYLRADISHTKVRGI